MQVAQLRYGLLAVLVCSFPSCARELERERVPLRDCAVPPPVQFGTLNTDFPHDVEEIQLRKEHIARVVQVIRNIPKAKVLIWGVGYDSRMWCAINAEGKTVFIEDNPKWADMTKKQITCPVVHVTYKTKAQDAAVLLKNKRRLTLDLPDDVRTTRFDVIVIDGPAGHSPHLPGRMVPIYMSAQLSHEHSHIFVDDFVRPIEKVYSDHFLQPIFGVPTILPGRAGFAHFAKQQEPAVVGAPFPF